MKKFSITALCLILPFLLFTSCQSDDPAPPPDPKSALSGKTAIDYFNDNGLRVGWNLGNALDSHRDNVGGEQEWSNPRIRQETLDGVKAAGFTVIRIPVTWRGHFGPAPGYAIAKDRMDRVAEVVDMAYNAGFKAVIINIHHDDSRPSSDNPVQGWLDVSKADDPSAIAAINAQFKRAWEQIAERFRDYGDWLIFEGFNEVHNGGWGWDQAPDRLGPIPQAQFDAVNNWNQVLVDVVRASGGNNAQRFLLIQPYNAKPHQAMSDKFIWPADTEGNEGKLILSIHYYEPNAFCLRGGTPAWTGTDEHKNWILNEHSNTTPGFTKFKERYIDRGILVIMGECGAAAASTISYNPTVTVSAADAYDLNGSTTRTAWRTRRSCSRRPETTA